MVPKNLLISVTAFALLSSLSEIVEIVILQRWIGSPDFTIFSPTSHYVHPLSRISEHVSHNFNFGRHTATIFLDTQQAFNSILFDQLIAKLIVLCVLIQQYLSDRTFQVRVGRDLSRFWSIGSGVPQGSKLFLLLSSLFSAHIPSHPEVTRELQVDDITLALSVEVSTHV